MRLEGRVSLITGAGGGIGRATALRLSEEGSDVALADINPALMAETATLVRHKTGRRVTERRRRRDERRAGRDDGGARRGGASASST